MFSVRDFFKVSSFFHIPRYVADWTIAIYIASTTPAALNVSLTSTLKEFRNKLLMVSSSNNYSRSAVSCTTAIPSGPYFLHAYTGNVYQAWRLYSDYEGAFTEGTIAHDDGNFSTLSASIAVYKSPKSRKKPELT